MLENNLGFHEHLPFLRPRWVTILCLILWGLAHVFGALAIVYLNCSLTLYEKGDLANQNPSTSTNQPPSVGLMIKVFEKATHKFLQWGLAAGAMSLLLIITGFGMWRMKKWSIIPIGLLILVSLPGILTALGLDLNLFK